MELDSRLHKGFLDLKKQLTSTKVLVHYNPSLELKLLVMCLHMELGQSFHMC